LIGKTISHYRVVDKIGQGGMGVVYKAEDTKLHRTVALKFLPPDVTRDSTEMARFIVEARAAASLSHPNICTIYEIDETAAQPFISMAYIEGKNLKDLVEPGPLKLEDALRYAIQVARGLEEAHAKGVVHRDIKSANIVVSDKGHAIVMDFGLAKLQGQTKLTRTGTTVGTVSYMSPEQARGEDVDRRSDIWSLGVVLYRMIAGRYPFEGEHASAVIYAVMNEPHPPLTSLRTGVPMELERIVDKALAKDPSRRYQTLSDMIVDLKDVRDQLSGTGSHPSRSPARPKTARSPRARWAVVAVAAAVVVVGLFGWRQFMGGRGGAEREVPKDERVSIAVLPLDNMSGNPDQEYVADGMTEALIAELAQIKALRVISRTSVMRFKGTTQSIPEIAKTLGVNTIIEGSIVQSGERVRVTAQLIDANTDEHLWAQSYERPMSDVLALQSDVARAIAGEVKVELTPRETEHLASARTINPRAYDLYLKGRYHWNRRTETDLKQALDLFRQASDIEPDWALAYTARAETYLVIGSWSALPPTETYPRAREFAQKALDLDPNDGGAWACLAGVASSWDWDWGKAEEDYRRAIDLEPNNASAHQWYAEFLLGQGRFDEALAQINQAAEIDPLSMIIKVVKGEIYGVQGDFARAVAQFESVTELAPDFVGVYNFLGNVYRFAGRNEEATEAYARYFESMKTGAGESIRKGYARGGMDEVVRVIINGTRQAGASRYISPTSMGMWFATIGQADSAMVWLDRAYRERDPALGGAAVSRNAEPIHNDPRFVDLLKRLRLDHVKPGYARG